MKITVHRCMRTHSKIPKQTPKPETLKKLVQKCISARAGWDLHRTRQRVKEGLLRSRGSSNNTVIPTTKGYTLLFLPLVVSYAGSPLAKAQACTNTCAELKHKAPLCFFERELAPAKPATSLPGAAASVRSQGVSHTPAAVPLLTGSSLV